MTTHPDFIIIDDEDLNNLVSKYQIARVHEKAKVKTFTDPRKGLEYLKEFIGIPIRNKTILLLDINMPGLNGWELMNELEVWGKIPQEMFRIYMLTSSIDPIDQEITKKNSKIAGFIAKPLMVDKLKLI